jgi:hypothetical protein
MFGTGGINATSRQHICITQMTLVFILKINIHFGFNGLLPFSSVLVYIHVRINVFTRTLRFFSSHLKSHHQPIVGLSSFLDVYVKVVKRTLYIYFFPTWLSHFFVKKLAWRNLFDALLLCSSLINSVVILLRHKI